MMMMKFIQDVLKDHTPVLEPEVVEYLESFVTNAIVDEDDADVVLSTLQQFLSSEECDVILLLLPNKEKEPEESMAVAEPKVFPSSFVKERKPSNPAALPPSSVHVAESNGKEKNSKATSKKSKHKERRLQKRKGRSSKVAPDSPQEAEEDKELIDDHASAWQECQNEGRLWGGRGQGGRGLRCIGDNLQSIHLPSVSLQFQGNELLVDSPMDVLQGHRYGLLGRNGIGKSTLLRQLAAGGIPGMPRNMRILLVQQQIQGRTDQTSVEALVEADTDRLLLLQEQEKIEQNLEAGIDLEQNADRLGDIVAELDVIDSDTAQERALEILQGLSFTEEMIHGPTASLSGGWRMRLALAQALFVQHSDLILLDECTNHLDLHGMDWLIRYLTQKSKHTLVVVSHDRGFLDAVCTDVSQHCNEFCVFGIVETISLSFTLTFQYRLWLWNINDLRIMWETIRNINDKSKKRRHGSPKYWMRRNGNGQRPWNLCKSIKIIKSRRILTSSGKRR
jgi:ABC-type multidrug transport system ATPase subunit